MKFAESSASVALLIAIIFICFGLYAWSSCTVGGVAPSQIVFAGKVVNNETKEWPNNRLVLAYLKGQEIGRTITALGGFSQSKQGKHDGLFVISVNNDYNLTADMLNESGKGGIPFVADRTLWPSYLYTWIDTLEEGGIYRIPVPTKNIEYVIKVVTGDVALLPPELKTPNSTSLKDDNTIVVNLKDKPSKQVPADNSIRVQNVDYGVRSQSIEVNKITVPLNNCGGNSILSQKYIQTQTFIHEYRNETQGSAGIEIGAWVKLVFELQTKYGFDQGQIDSRSVEYDMAAQARTNVVYTVVWKEQWESGVGNVTSGKDNISIPFSVRTNLSYQVDSQSLPCN